IEANVSTAHRVWPPLGDYSRVVAQGVAETRLATEGFQDEEDVAADQPVFWHRGWQWDHLPSDQFERPVAEKLAHELLGRQRGLGRDGHRKTSVENVARAQSTTRRVGSST